MNSNPTVTKQWILIGATSGIIASIVYPLLLLVSLPSFLEIFLAGMFGILISLSGFSIHKVISITQPNAYTEVAALFIFSGGIILNLMLVIQLNFVGKLRYFKAETISEVDENILKLIGKAVDPVHLAFDVSWDFFLGIATILFSVFMFKNVHFGKFWAIPGFILAITLMVIEFSSFPLTPYDLGLPYIFGPLLSLWYLAVSIQCLRKRNSVDYSL